MLRNSRMRLTKFTVSHFNLSQSIVFSLPLCRARANWKLYLFINLINELWVRQPSEPVAHMMVISNIRPCTMIECGWAQLSYNRIWKWNVDLSLSCVCVCVCCEGEHTRLCLVINGQLAIAGAQGTYMHEWICAEADIDSEAMIKIEHTRATATGFVLLEFVDRCGFDASLLRHYGPLHTHARGTHFADDSFSGFGLTPSAQSQRFQNHLSLWICVTVAAVATAIISTECCSSSRTTTPINQRDIVRYLSIVVMPLHTSR